MNINYEEQKLATIISYSKKIETLLKKNGATGKGMHSYLSSIEGKLNSKLIKDIRWIATMRNKSLHENFIINDIKGFEKTSKRVINQLNNISKLEKNSSASNEVTEEEMNIFYIFIILIIAFFYFHFYGGEDKDVIQKKIQKIDLKIEKLNNSISTNENQILNKIKKLDSEVKNQGLIHSMFIDTDIVNELESELKNLKDIRSQLKDKKEELVEEKEDLQEDLD